MTLASIQLAESIRAVSVSDAARLSGVPRRSIQSILDGKCPSVDRAQKIAEAIGLEFYLGSKSERASANAVTHSQNLEPDQAHALAPDAILKLQQVARTLNLVLVEFDVAPGVGWGPADEDGLHTVGDGWFRMDWMARQGAVAANCRMGELHGRDMEPTLCDGCAILVDRSRVDPEPRGIFLIRRDDARICRRLVKRSGGWIMHADNPICVPEPLRKSTDIVGKVLWSAREHGDDDGPIRSPVIDERTMREELAMIVSLMRGLNRRERDRLLDAARHLPADELLQVGLDASHAVLASMKEAQPA